MRMRRRSRVMLRTRKYSLAQMFTFHSTAPLLSATYYCQRILILKIPCTVHINIMIMLCINNCNRSRAARMEHASHWHLTMELNAQPALSFPHPNCAHNDCTADQMRYPRPASGRASGLAGTYAAAIHCRAPLSAAATCRGHHCRGG